MENKLAIIVVAIILAVAAVIYFFRGRFIALLGGSTTTTTTTTGTGTTTSTQTSTGQGPVTVTSGDAAILSAFKASGYLDALAAEGQHNLAVSAANTPTLWLKEHPYLFNTYPTFFKQ